MQAVRFAGFTAKCARVSMCLMFCRSRGHTRSVFALRITSSVPKTLALYYTYCPIAEPLGAVVRGLELFGFIRKMGMASPIFSKRQKARGALGKRFEAGQSPMPI